jgi:gas vesicle protein
MRVYIQTKLNELSNIEIGPFIPDGMIENGTTYFGYQLQEDYQSSDTDKNDHIRVSIQGFVLRKVSTSEDTLQIIDEASNQIKNKLKELNFKVSLKDVTLNDDIRKIQVTGYVYYNEINNKLIF